MAYVRGGSRQRTDLSGHKQTTLLRCFYHYHVLQATAAGAASRKAMRELRGRPRTPHRLTASRKIQGGYGTLEQPPAVGVSLTKGATARHSSTLSMTFLNSTMHRLAQTMSCEDSSFATRPPCVPTAAAHQRPPPPLPARPRPHSCRYGRPSLPLPEPPPRRPLCPPWLRPQAAVPALSTPQIEEDDAGQSKSRSCKKSAEGALRGPWRAGDGVRAAIRVALPVRRRLYNR